MAVPPQHKPAPARAASASSYCSWAALRPAGRAADAEADTETAPRPPQPLRTFDDVKLDLVEEGAEVPQVLEAPTASQAPRAHDAPRAGLPNRTKVALLQQARTSRRMAP